MKTAVHPTYYASAKVTCVCGSTFTVGSTVEDLHVELCSKCHPFYTGTQKMVDTAGRVDKFQKRTEAKATTPSRSKRAKLVGKAAKRQLKVDESRNASAKSAA